MLKEQRQQSIVRVLQESGSARVSDLAHTLESSRATIWRDIDQLARRGVVTKVHGGATLVQPDRQDEDVEKGLELASPRHGLIIGFQIPESLYYFGPIVTGAKRACELAGAELVVTTSGYGLDDMYEAVEGLRDVDADGVLLTPTFTPSNTAETTRWLASSPTPVVLVERELPGLGIPQVRSVSTAREAGTFTALQHLQGLGHEHVGLVSLNDSSEPMRRVIDGWHGASRVLGLNRDTERLPVWIGQDSDEIVTGILESGVSAVLCMNDAFAAKLLRALRRAGIECPDQLSVITHDDELAEHLKPALTAISPEREMVGFLAVQQLMAMLNNGSPGPSRRIAVDPKLVIRSSTAPPRRARSGPILSS